MNRVYLDYNATTPLDSSVLECIYSTLKDCWGNPGSDHECGRKAALILEQSREDLARMLDADSRDIIFTSGGTEANNWVIEIARQHFLTKMSGQNHVTNDVVPHVVTTNIEHDSIRFPLEILEEKKRLDVTFVPVSSTTGSVDVETIMCAIKPNTCLVTVMMANNETGAIQPIDKISQAIKELNRMRQGLCSILMHTDAAQAVGKIPVNVKDLAVDYLTVVGHKFYGPRIGALYAKNPGVNTVVFPLFYGGGQERTFRPGTENVGMIAGLGKAAQLVSDNLDRYADHMRDVCDYFETQLQAEFGDKIHINNKFPNTLPNTLSISFVGKGLEGFKVLNSCRHLEASVGAACHSKRKVSPILLSSGVKESHALNAIRLSIGRDTTKSDIDVVIQDLRQAVSSLTSIQELGLKPEAEQTKALDYSLEKN